MHRERYRSPCNPTDAYFADGIATSFFPYSVFGRAVRSCQLLRSFEGLVGIAFFAAATHAHAEQLNASTDRAFTPASLWLWLYTDQRPSQSSNTYIVTDIRRRQLAKMTGQSNNRYLGVSDATKENYGYSGGESMTSEFQPRQIMPKRCNGG